MAITNHIDMNIPGRIIWSAMELLTIHGCSRETRMSFTNEQLNGLDVKSHLISGVSAINTAVRLELTLKKWHVLINGTIKGFIESIAFLSRGRFLKDFVPLMLLDPLPKLPDGRFSHWSYSSLPRSSCLCRISIFRQPQN